MDPCPTGSFEGSFFSEGATVDNTDLEDDSLIMNEGQCDASMTKSLKSLGVARSLGDRADDVVLQGSGEERQSFYISVYFHITHVINIRTARW